MLIIDLRFEAKGSETVFGKTPFGVIGVRMAKTIGVNDGGGSIRSSSGAVNEKEAFRKPARWIDYSGPIVSTTIEGITLLDHPINPNHPSVMHVRDDGWMGASLTFHGPRRLPKGETLNLRYGLYIHGGMPSTDLLQHRWFAFANSSPEPFPKKRN